MGEYGASAKVKVIVVVVVVVVLVVVVVVVVVAATDQTGRVARVAFELASGSNFLEVPTRPVFLTVR